MGDVAQPHGREILEHLIFQLVTIDHQQDGWLIGLRRFEKHLRGFDHRIGFAASLSMPDEPSRKL